LQSVIKVNQGKRYANLMDGCAKAYSKRECEATETARLKMSRDQPKSQYNYTEVGFKKIRVGAKLFEIIKSFYEKNKEKRHLEQWGRGYTYTNHWVSPTYMVSTEDSSLRGAGTGLKSQIWSEVKPIIEEWTGHSIKPTSLYGIREYTDGAILATHVDRLPLVSSCIINVYQEVTEPWPLEVYDHKGQAHNVTMEAGDMVLYEVRLNM
jgi:prolyl 4-hydroxylase